MPPKKLKQRGQAWLTYGALLLLGILVGHFYPGNSATPRSVTGTVSQVVPGTATVGTTITLTPKGGKPAQFQLSDHTSWQIKPGNWTTTGTPPCLSAGVVRTASSSPGGKQATAASITIGVVSVQSSNGVPPRNLVVWVQCQG